MFEEETINERCLAWFGDALEVKNEDEERAEARRQEQTSSSGHPHHEVPLRRRSPRHLVDASPRFIRVRLDEDARHANEIGTYTLF